MTVPSKISEQIDLHDLPDLRLKAYWAIDKMSSPDKDRFTIAEITAHLIERAGVTTYPQLVRHALTKSKTACDRNQSGYKLMQDGKNELKQCSAQNGVVFIDANRPFSAKSFTLNRILGEDYHDLVICDPYIDHNTLDVIFKNFKKKIPIRFLTARIIDKPTGMLKRQLKDLKDEGFNVEIKVYGSSVLHDRYIINEKHFLFSGNSFNHLGTKESFLILLGEDTRQSMLAMFNSRWKIATAYT